jgi:PKD domain/Peptidase family M28
MSSRMLRACCLCAFAFGFLLHATGLVPARGTSTIWAWNAKCTGAPCGYQGGLADFPTVDPNYIYDQLFYMATHFQHREAGFDSNLPVNINGHDEFANYWTQEIVHDLQGFGPQIRHDSFPVLGWLNRPATVPAFNVEVSVPGITHPEQIVVIGCHYDGQAISTQSANDDVSGCAIELGVARAMGIYWRSHHVYPARTLRFVIFDAEEQGLFGSFHYLNSTVNGDTRNIVAMFNEEQNGIAYPLRFLGKTSNPLLPFYIDMSPLTDGSLYPAQSKLSQAQRDNFTHFRALMQQAVVAAFMQFQALGFQSLTYHNNTNQDVSQPIFTPDQISNVHQEDDTLGGSDQIPFTLAGLSCATLVGNSTYYNQDPPPWSYPFDQAQDTIQLMNTFASGSSQKAQALVLALALPGMLTTWMLNQPDILGQAPADGNPIAAISDIGQTQVGQSISLDAMASFDPQGNPLSYAWNFGDGATATGIAVNHVYSAAGSYTLTLTVSSATGKRRISKIIDVVTHSTSYANPYPGGPGNLPDGNPPHNPAVVLPIPNNNPASTTTTQANTTGSFPIGAIVFVLAAILIVGVLVIAGRRRQRR